MDQDHAYLKLNRLNSTVGSCRTVMLIVMLATIASYVIPLFYADIYFNFSLFFPMFFNEYAFAFSFLSASMIPVFLGLAINVLLLIALVALYVTSKKSAVSVALYIVLTILNLVMVFQYGYEFNFTFSDLFIPVIVGAGALLFAVIHMICMSKLKKPMELYPSFGMVENPYRHVNAGEMQPAAIPIESVSVETTPTASIPAESAPAVDNNKPDADTEIKR